VKFLETSAKGNINVEEAFVTIAKAIKDKMDRVCLILCYISNAVQLAQPTQGKASSGDGGSSNVKVKSEPAPAKKGGWCLI
jgi:hypothetical protein